MQLLAFEVADHPWLKQEHREQAVRRYLRLISGGRDPDEAQVRAALDELRAMDEVLRQRYGLLPGEVETMRREAETIRREAGEAG